ncbi:MAG: T9SS type A sorting domain-containing protein [Bacteroidota bacterium]
MKLARLLFLLCLLIALCTRGRAQCPSGNVSITTDTEAMDYENDFGGCQSLPGDLTLDGPITYTKAFQNLQEVQGNLDLVSTAFQLLDDFAALEVVGGNLTIKGTQLTDEIAGTSLQLQEVGGTFALDNNPNLKGTAALENLDQVDDVILSNNAILQNITALAGTTINGKVTIQNNASLGECAVSGVCAAIAANVANNTTIFISGNTGNCVSKYHVEADCLGSPDCPPDVFVKTNQEVSDFADAFPNCADLAGELNIGGTVTNGFPLRGLKNVGSDVNIDAPLSDLNWLGLVTVGGDFDLNDLDRNGELADGPLPLEEVGGRFRIGFCDGITDLASFGNLRRANGLGIFNMPDLTSVSGLQNLELEMELVVLNVDGLIDLNSFSGVNVNGKTFHLLALLSNDNLQDISYLEDLAAVTGELRIQVNPNLAECSITPVCATIAAGTAVTVIENNDSDCNSVTEVRDICFPDLAPLLALYNATDGPNWTDNTGWANAAAGQGLDPCSGWFGVTCDNGRVIVLDLNPDIIGNNLTGSLPLAFYNLPRLRALDLSFNNLTGNLSGDIGLMTALEDLNLGINDFSGLLPGGIGLLASLRSLKININNFNGSLPSGLSQLQNLNQLWLNDNNFSGTVRADLGDLPLRRIRLDRNNFEGPLPKITTTNLAFYEASGNNFSGFIPEDLFPASVSPSTVALHNNALSGPLPEALARVQSSLRLNSNDLAGCYPTNYAALCTVSTSFINNPGLPDGGSNEFFNNEFCGMNDACGALPVTWLSLSATPVGKTVALAWATAAEENNASFTVERSANGVDWAAISSRFFGYEFTDAAPLAGSAYYRIRQTDFDGAFSFSPVARVTFTASEATAYPNPFRDELILFSDRPELIQLIDQQGRVVQKVQHAGAGAQVQRMGLKSGVYLLQYLGSGRTERVVAR